MPGIFDSLFSDENAANLALAAGLLGGKGSLNQVVGQALTQGQAAATAATQRKRQAELDALTKQRFQLALDEEQRKKQQYQALEQFRSSIPEPTALAGVDWAKGPTPAAASQVTPIDPLAKLSYAGMKAGAIDPMEWLKSQQKDKTPIKGSPGDVFFQPGSFKELARVAPKPEGTPSALQEYQFAKANGEPGTETFTGWMLAQKKAGATKVSMNTDEKGFKNELAIKQDFRQEPIYKDYQDMQTAYKQVQGAIKQGTPIADTAAATKIMKLLDPGSTVRESELGLAMAATGKLDRMKNYFQMQMSGNKLNPQQRKDFGELADEFYDAAGLTYNAKRSEYEGIGKRYGLNTSGLGPAHKPVKAMKSIREQADAIIGQ